MCPFCQSVRSFLAGHTSFLSTLLCVNTEMLQPPPLLWPQLHSSHAPLTRSLSLPLSMHESLSFFLLTNVRAYQKCLHLLSSIMHSIFSTNHPYPPALGHSSLAGGGWFSPHSTPPPLPNYISASALLASVLNRVRECYTPHTALSSLLPPLLLSQHCSSPGSAWVCQGKAAAVAKAKDQKCPSWGLLISRDEKLITRKLLLHWRVFPLWQQADTVHKHYSALKRNKQVLCFLHLPPVLMNPALLFIGCNLSELLYISFQCCMKALHIFPWSASSTFLGSTAGLTSIKHLLLFKTDFLNFQIILIFQVMLLLCKIQLTPYTHLKTDRKNEKRGSLVIENTSNKKNIHCFSLKSCFNYSSDSAVPLKR